MELFFFNPDETPPSKEDRLAIAETGFDGYVGNADAVKRLKRVAFSAFGQYNHRIDQNFAFLGPSSTGKTTLASKFAKLVRLPFVEISPTNTQKVSDVLVQIAKVCDTKSALPTGCMLDVCNKMVLFLSDLYKEHPESEASILEAVESIEHADLNSIDPLIAAFEKLQAVNPAIQEKLKEALAALHVAKEKANGCGTLSLEEGVFCEQCGRANYIAQKLKCNCGRVYTFKDFQEKRQVECPGCNGIGLWSFDPIGPCEWCESGKVRYDQAKVIIPPCIVFIDEVHLLKNNVMQGLLKATEPKDHTLVTENNWIADTRNVCWIIATTDRGLLFDAFDTRFTKINLSLYSQDEIQQIIKLNYPEWDDDQCEWVAAKGGGRVPREALFFAKEVKTALEIYGADKFYNLVSQVAEENGIDYLGMTVQRLNLLIALGDGAISKNRLANVAGCKEEELVKYVLPPLLATTADQKSLITVSNKGYELTDAGYKQLDIRCIVHSRDREKQRIVGKLNNRFTDTNFENN